MFEIGTNHYRNREASWNFSDSPVNDRNDDINLDDVLLQHAGVHPTPGRIWAVKLSKTVKSIIERCPTFNLLQETKYLEDFFFHIPNACGSILIQKIVDLFILLTLHSQLSCHVLYQ